MQLTPALAYRASITASCAVAAARLFPFLGDRVMHRDEALTVMVARRPLGELLETVQLVRGGAPLHFLLAKLVAEFDGGLVATRAISALGLLLAIVAVGLLGRAIAGPAVGAAAAWILALSPVALYYGDFARMYSLFLAFSALALWCLVRALDTDEPRFWAATAVLLVLNTYTHPYGVVVGLIAALAVIVELLQVRERAAWRRPLYAAAGVIAGTAPLGIGYLVLASRLDKVPQPPGTAIPKPSLADVAAQAGAHFVGVPRSGGPIAIYLIVCAALALIGTVTIARGGRRSRRAGRLVDHPPAARPGRRAHPELRQPRALRDRDAAARGHRDRRRRGDARADARVAWGDRRRARRRRARRNGRGDAWRAPLRLPLPRRRVGLRQGRARPCGEVPAHQFRAQRPLPGL